MEAREVSLYISVPSYRGWSPYFGTALTGMLQYLVQNGVRAPGVKLIRFIFNPMLQASCLSQARQQMLKNATDGGFTHWLCLADDMVYPPDFLDYLFRHDIDIVAANYRRKRPDVVGVFQGLDGAYVDSTGKSGLEEVAWIGLDSCLMNVVALNSVPAPHFEVRWCEETQSYWDLDMFFSRKVREHGLKIFCDHDAAQHIQHMGEVAHAWPQVIAQ